MTYSLIPDLVAREPIDRGGRTGAWVDAKSVHAALRSRLDRPLLAAAEHAIQAGTPFWWAVADPAHEEPEMWWVEQVQPPMAELGAHIELRECALDISRGERAAYELMAHVMAADRIEAWHAWAMAYTLESVMPQEAYGEVVTLSNSLRQCEEWARG